MRYISLLILTITLFSCKKETVEPTIENTPLDQGILVLCEGLFQQNNSTLSWIDLNSGTVENDFYNKRVGRGLGDTGNDMIRYGSKIYVAVNVSSTIEIHRASDFASLKQISMVSGGVSKQPRYLLAHQGKVYITCFDGYVDVLDTTSLTITQRIAVGDNPEGLAAVGNKLYVANSGGLNFPGLDSTLSVIDLNSNLEVAKITVGKNPWKVISDPDGDIYVIVRGNYGNIPPRLKRIDSATDQLVETFPFHVSDMTIAGNELLIASVEDNSVARFDWQSELVLQSSFISLAGVSTFYGITYHAGQNAIYICDAMNYTNSGYLRKYTTSGVLSSSYNVGLNPSKVLFYE
jgi:YVTN family beta-propeller protein